MKKLLIILYLYLSIVTTGCSHKPKYIQLNKGSIGILNPSKIKEICIISQGKTIYYHYEFSITDPEKIKIIIECLQGAQQIKGYQQKVLWGITPEPNKSEYALRHSRRNIIFKTRRAKYETKIAWDDDAVYGAWWQSAELLKHFKKWNLFEDIGKADPNFPPPDWTKNPPKDQVAPESPIDYNIWWD